MDTVFLPKSSAMRSDYIIDSVSVFAPASQRARALGKPAVLELRIDSEYTCYGMPGLSQLPPI
jgi:hypothetical protein